MHSFLSKVFGRKKEDKETSPTTLAPGELLDGRFEAVSPNVSPSANHFLELDPPKTTNGQEIGFSLFRGKSRPSSPEVNQRKLDNLPHLSLNFRETKEELASRQLGFLSDTDLDTQGLLSDAVIGQRRLNPLEALVLIQACSKAITTRGLETLGIMHPHWYSSSADVQRRIISRYINSLNLQNSDTVASPSSLTSPTSLFESEIHFSRSPHDIAAVLRWGLRHLQIEGDSFGTDDGWYKAFLDAEAAAEYPPKAFSEKLAPHLPPAHLDLLTATLEIFSSLAAHAEANSTSGSKLSKMFGLWLLTARRVEDKDDWSSFYARWERTGRMLEHIFLARIRDESVDQRMPVRLLELVRTYPYTRGLSSPATDLPLLPRPRFTTPVFDALFVRIEIEFPKASLKPKSKMHPLNLLADAFSTQVAEGEFAELWAKITAASKDGSNPSPLSNIFADETIRFLSIIPDGRAAKSQDAKSPTFTLLQTSPMKKSFSEGNQEPPVASTSQHKRVMSEPVVSTPISPLVISDIGSDWAQFSSSGFLDSTPAIGPLVSTLFDTDIEKTVPPNPVSLSRKSSKRMKGSRKSIEVPRLSISENGVLGTAQAADVPPQETKPVVKASKLEIVQFDEAFIDFWSDSLLDPLTSTWPTFIICKFKSTLVPTLLYGPVVEGESQKTLKWLILEQVYTVKAPPPPPPAPVVTPVVVSTPAPETARPASPSFSVSGKKRFNFWSVSRTGSSSSVNSQKGKKRDNSPKVGEMGELIEEEVKPQASVSKGKKVEEQKPVVEEAPVQMKVEESKVQEAPVVEAKAEVAVTAAAAVAATAAVATVAVVATSAEEGVISEEPAGVKETNIAAPSEIPSVNGAANAQTEEIVAPKEEIPVVEETGADKEPAADVVTAAVDEVVPAEQIEAKELTLAPEPEQAAPPVAEVEPQAESVGVETEATAVVEGVAEEEVTPKDEVKVEEQAPPTEAVEIQEVVVPETAEHVVDVAPAAEDVSPDIPAVVEAENMTNVAEEVVEESAIPIAEPAAIELESAPSHDVEVAVGSAADVPEESKTQDEPVISPSGEEESVPPSEAPVVLESVPETVAAEISAKDVVDEIPVARDESLQFGAVEESAAAVDVENVEPMDEIVQQSETVQPVVEPATVKDESSQAAETPSVVESIPEDVAPTVEEVIVPATESAADADITTSELAVNDGVILQSSPEEPASSAETVSDGAPHSLEIVAEDVTSAAESKVTVPKAATEPVAETLVEGTAESVDVPEPKEDITESEPIIASVVEDEVRLSGPAIEDAAAPEVETAAGVATNESNIEEAAVASQSLAEPVTVVEIPPAEEPATALEEASIAPVGEVVTESDNVDIPEVAVVIEPSTEPVVEAEDTKPEIHSAEVVDNPSTRESITVVESIEEQPVAIQPETVVQPVPIEPETAVVQSDPLAEAKGQQANDIVEPDLADTATVGNVAPGGDGVTVEIPSESITESTSHDESISDSIPTNTGAQVISSVSNDDEIVLTSTEDATAAALPTSDVEPQLTNTDQTIEHLTEETSATTNGNLEHSEDVKHDDAESEEFTVVEHSPDVQNSATASPSVEATETHITPASADQGLPAAQDASLEEVEQEEVIPETRDEHLASVDVSGQMIQPASEDHAAEDPANLVSTTDEITATTIAVPSDSIEDSVLVEEPIIIEPSSQVHEEASAPGEPASQEEPVPVVVEEVVDANDVPSVDTIAASIALDVVEHAATDSEPIKTEAQEKVQPEFVAAEENPLVDSTRSDMSSAEPPTATDAEAVIASEVLVEQPTVTEQSVSEYNVDANASAEAAVPEETAQHPTIDEPQIELPPAERDEDAPSQSSALEKSIAIGETPMVAEDLGETVLESTLAQDQNSIAVEVSSAITEEIIPESIQAADPIPVFAIEEPIAENSVVGEAAVEESSEPVDEKIAESNIVDAVVEEATEHSTLSLKEPTIDEVAVEGPSAELEQSIVEPTVEEPSAELVIEKPTIDEQNAEVVDESKIAEPIVEAPIVEVSTTETVETLTNEEPSVENLVAEEPHEEVTIVEDQAIEGPVETSVKECPVENVAVDEFDEKAIVETPIIEESSIQRHEDYTQAAPLDSVEVAAEVNPAVVDTIVDEPTVTEPIVSETVVDESSTAIETSTTDPTTVESVADEPAAQPLVVPSVEELSAVERPESVPEAVAAESTLRDEQVIEQPVESSMHQETDDQPSLEQVTIEDAGIEQLPPQEALAVLNEPIQEEPAAESQDAVLEEPVVEAPVVLAEKIVEESVTDEPAVVNRIIEEESAVEMIPASTTIPAIADISSADAEEGDQDKTDDVLASNTSSVDDTAVPTEPIVETSTILASVQEEELESQIPELVNEENTQDVIHEASLEESVEPPPMASEEHIQDAQVESAPLDEIILEPVVLNDEKIEQPVILAESQEDVREVPIPAPVSDNTEEGQQQLEDATSREAEAIDVSTAVVSEPELSDAPIEIMLSQEDVSSSAVDEAKADEEVKTEEIFIEPPAVEGHAIEEPIVETKPVSEDFSSRAMDTSANTDQDVENVGVDAISAPSAEEVQPAAGETILDVDSIESTGVTVEELPVETLQDSPTSALPVQEEMPVSDALETEASEKNVEDRSHSIAPTTIISEEPTVVNDEVVEQPANHNEPHNVEVQESVPEIVEEPVSSAVDNTAGEVDSILVDVAQPQEEEKPVVVAASTLVEPTRESSSEPPVVTLENNAGVAGEASTSAEETVEQLSVEASATEEPVVDDKVITEPSLEEDVTNVVDAPVAVTAENAPGEQDIPTEDESINVAAEESVVENVGDAARLPVQESPVVPDILDKEETSEVVEEPILVESTGPETIVSEEPVQENVSAALVEETQAASAVSDVLEKEEADAVVEDITPSDSTCPATIPNEELIQEAVVEPALIEEEQVAAPNGNATIAMVDEQPPISPEETTADVIQDHPDEVQMEVDDEKVKERILPEELVEILASEISSELPVNVEPPTETPLANISEPSIEIPAAEAPLAQATTDSVAVTNEHSISEPSEEVSVKEAASSVVDAPVASPENVAEDVEISSSVPQEVKPSVEGSSSERAVVVADEPVIETVEDAPTSPLSIQEEVPVVPDVLEKEAAAETVDERIPSDSITPVTIVSDEPVEEFAPAPALVEEEVVAGSNGEVVIATTEEQPAISVEEAVDSTHLGEEPVSPHVEEVVEDTVEESAPSEAVVDVPTNDDINRPTPVDVAPAQTETPLASVSESVVENTPTIDAPSVEVAPLESVVVTDDISAADPGEAASVEVPAVAEHPIEVLPVEAEEQAPPEAPVVEEPTAEDLAPSDVIAPESLANGETIAPESAEQIVSPSGELAEDADVATAEVEVETEAFNGNGNGSGTHHGTTEIHKIEIPDIIHRSVSENISSSVLSPWSDDNTQVGELLSPLSPTTLVDEVLSVPVDLASKIENLVAGGNGHEVAPPEESSVTSKADLDIHTPAPIEDIHTATINTEEPTTL
ncbi:hypothetical protein BDN70DRAFT_824947 [Pholiota conissans]|uniref:Meiotically up-regulated protein Msb1/Mug8 domain-containing protein n=1 Tax=Pholiota conissans TaxID=109636 RepID=A0A9P6D5Q8_9AGAR|nr:hypothetical protein BDN70DRAFT_824947 [Pholiota conissans]